MTKKENLVIIGNGFDLWQGLKTSYKDFYKYYSQHRTDIRKKLEIQEITVNDGSGNIYEITPVELIYGDIYDTELDYFDFWNTFEDSLGELDTFNLNLYFGKEKSDLEDFKRSVRNAGRILREAFCNWVLSINIDEKQSEFKLKNNCLFINFNYTNTLEKIFNVDENDVIHIHGIATDKNSIIFGHSIHPQKPEETLKDFGGRFLGLYLAEKMLYETDKHARNNITNLGLDMTLAEVDPDEINNIFILGHSLGDADFEYFKYLKSVTSIDNEDEDEKIPEFEDYYNDEEMINRMQYAIKKYGEDYSIDENISPEEEAAAHKKYLLEQFETDSKLINKKLNELKKSGKLTENFLTFLEAQKTPKRKVDAMWHISCHTKADKEKAEALMKKIHCKNYKLYDDIDDIMPLIAELE